MRTVLVQVLSLLFAYTLGSAAAAPRPTAGPNGEKLNGCGCYQDQAGNCQCTNKKAKCVCPGECEPVGCEEKRSKAMEKEADKELKKQKQIEKDKEKLSKDRKNTGKNAKTNDDKPSK